MLRKITIAILSFILFFTYNLHSKKPYRIGFSQCTSGDIWRETMEREMLIELSFFPQLELTIKDANNSNEKQINDIQQFLADGIDLLIVSPNESAPVTPIVEKVFHSGIPVIIIDRKITSNAYTAYIGADNYLIGKEAGKYAAQLLQGKGKVFEIGGLKGSSPAIDRNRGFMESIKQFQKIEVIRSESGKWNYSDSKDVMYKFLEKKIDFDLVFAHNDVMAKAAREIAEEKGIYNKFFLGIDGLYGPEGGIQFVIDKKLDATFLYQTGGEEAIQLTHKILNKLPFDRENILKTVVIDSSNAEILKLQTDEILNFQDKIEAQKEILDKQVARFNSQQNLLITVLLLLGAIVILVLLVFRAYRKKQQANLKLALQKNEIEKQNVEITTQRDQIIKVSEKLEEATQAKLRFFTNISHEFRTPLTLIVGPLENLIHSEDIPDKFQNQLKLMHRNSLRLLRMINQLMDFRKIENEKMKLQAGKYNLVDFTEDIKKSFDNLAARKQIRLHLNSTKPFISLWFDWDKLDKVIFNLLSNAFKFTPENGVIDIRIKVQEADKQSIWNNEAIIEIEDSGRGISTKHLNHIFDRFYQVEKKPENMGTGLGLSLSKEFIELHHGKINVTSTEGKGTCFTILLPMGEAHLNENEKITTVASEQPVRNENLMNEIHENPVLSNEDPTGKVIPSDKQTILLVEDEKDVRSYLKESLQEFYQILEAENGKSAIQIIMEEEPDLVISDVMMPVMDGLELTRTLKNDIKTCHIPVILLTAKASQDQKFEGLEEGADSYIPKPFNSQHLQIRIKKLLELRKKIHERYKEQLIIKEDENELSSLDRKFLNKITEIIETQIDKEEFSVEELSQQVGLSRVHVYRKIKKLTGMSVSEFVRSVKLKLSLKLIKSGKSISEVAYAVGFSSPSYFAKCFKGQFGISPSEFSKK